MLAGNAKNRQEGSALYGFPQNLQPGRDLLWFVQENVWEEREFEVFWLAFSTERNPPMGVKFVMPRGPLLGCFVAPLLAKTRGVYGKRRLLRHCMPRNKLKEQPRIMALNNYSHTHYSFPALINYWHSRARRNLQFRRKVFPFACFCAQAGRASSRQSRIFGTQRLHSFLLPKYQSWERRWSRPLMRRLVIFFLPFSFVPFLEFIPRRGRQAIEINKLTRGLPFPADNSPDKASQDYHIKLPCASAQGHSKGTTTGFSPKRKRIPKNETLFGL